MSVEVPTVSLTPTAEQDALRDTLRSLFSKSAPRPKFGEHVTADRDQLRALGGQLGVLGFDIGVDLGDPGGTMADTAVLNIEAGRALCSLPLVTYAAAGRLLAAANDDLLAPVLNGELLAGLIGLPDPADLTVSRSGDRATLDGVSPVVLGGDADVTLVIAHTADGPLVVAVDRDAAGVDIRQSESLDLTRPWTRYRFDGTSARVLPGASDAAVIRSAAERAMVAVAADQLGVCIQSVEPTVEYAKMRYQFGRPIGRNQAVKHRLVNMALSAERATAAVEYAARSFAQNTPRTTLLAALESATTAAVEVTSDAIQVLGGIGMTWEHPAHLYLRRALSNQALFGPPRELRRELAGLLWPADRAPV